MLLDDLESYLVPLLGGSPPVQKGFFQEIPDTAVALRETGGYASQHVMHGGLGGILDEPTVQVVTRAKDYQTAMSLCRSLYLVLDGLRDTVLNGVTYNWITAMQPPFFLMRDENHRFQCAFNVHIRRNVP